MPIPTIPEFEGALSALKIGDKTPDANMQSLRIETAHHQKYYVTYPDSHAITPKAIVERIKKQLRISKLAASTETAEAILALFAVYKPSHLPNATAFLNSMLDTARVVGVTHTYVTHFSIPPHTPKLRVSRFVIGPVDRAKLAYRFERVGADYLQLRPTEFHGKYGLEVDPAETNLLTLTGLQPPQRHNMWAFVYQNYYHSVAAVLRNSIDAEIQSANMILQELIRPGILNALLISDHNTHYMTVFDKLPNSEFEGWAVPHIARIDNVDVSWAPEAVQNLASLEQQYGFTFWDDTEILQSMKSFCKFTARAAVAGFRDEHGDAVLNYAIGLDLLFGDDAKLTNSISNRVAALTHLALGKEYTAVRDEVKRLYNLRSRFVHSGRSCSNDDLGFADEIAHVILNCMLRLYKSKENRGDDFISNWLKTLDYISVTLEAGRKVPEEEFIRAGSV